MNFKKVTVGSKTLRVESIISAGSYGKVYLVSDLSDASAKYALKISIAQNQERFELAEKEISFLKEFSKEKNDHFVQYIDSKIKHNLGVYKIYLLMEYCSQGNLFDLICRKQKSQETFSEEEIVDVVRQINSSLSFMHQQGYQYRDLKIENLLVFEGNKIKFCDFGSISNKEIDFAGLKPSEA